MGYPQSERYLSSWVNRGGECGSEIERYTPTLGVCVNRECGRWNLDVVVSPAPHATTRVDSLRENAQEWVRVLRERAQADPIGVDEQGQNIPDPELTRIADALASYFPSNEATP